MNKTNASLAAALAEAHRALFEDLQDLEQGVQPSSAAGPKEVNTRLQRLRTHLEAHFRFEEQNGYMQAVLARAPHLERTVNRLRSEHGELLLSLAALADEAGGAQGLSADFRGKVRHWIQQVRDHEARENLLVEDTFNRDLGAED